MSKERLGSLLEREVAGLHPAYFAMVMATGIVSIAAYLLELSLLAITIFWINIAAYVILWAMTIARVIWYRSNFYHDLIDHTRGVGNFTIVAGTGVLGSQFVLIFQEYQIASFLWVLGIVLWALLIYAIFTAYTVKETKPSLAEGINGAWLLAVVATQSVSVLGGLLVSQFDAYRQQILFFSLSLWLFGCMLYIWIISLIFYRYTFFKFSPSDLTPPYWINMGALAITTLAGATLIVNAPNALFLQDMLPFLKGFTLFFWAIGTWWIPMLLILGIWRHLYKKFKLAYDPLYWGLVFPLGMYTACTFQMARAMDLEFLYVIPKYFFYVALLAWVVILAGLIHRLVSGFIIFVKQVTAGVPVNYE